MLKTCLHRFLMVLLLCTAAFPLSTFAQNPAAETAVKEDAYTLGSGDRLRITVFGEEDLSGEFELDGSGTVALPLIGNISANRLDVRNFEKRVESKLADGYLVSPRVSIEVMNFRPFFILGEVNKPGSYPYVNGLTVINAVALAGGYTHRARTDRVLISRGKGQNKTEMEAHEDTAVLPGDSIRVSERFF